jgi:hypothetical protein
LLASASIRAKNASRIANSSGQVLVVVWSGRLNTAPPNPPR